MCIHRRLFLVAAFLLFHSFCFCQKHISKPLLSKYGLSDTLFKNWHQDKKGCLNVRCQYSDSLSKNKLLIGISKKDFFKIFGKPNKREDCYTYYTCSMCDAHEKKIKYADGCWLVFCFEDGKLEKCTMQCN